MVERLAARFEEDLAFYFEFLKLRPFRCRTMLRTHGVFAPFPASIVVRCSFATGRENFIAIRGSEVTEPGGSSVAWRATLYF